MVHLFDGSAKYEILYHIFHFSHFIYELLAGSSFSLPTAGRRNVCNIFLLFNCTKLFWGKIKQQAGQKKKKQRNQMHVLIDDRANMGQSKEIGEVVEPITTKGGKSKLSKTKAKTETKTKNKKKKKNGKRNEVLHNLVHIVAIYCCYCRCKIDLTVLQQQ